MKVGLSQKDNYCVVPLKEVPGAVKFIDGK